LEFHPSDFLWTLNFLTVADLRDDFKALLRHWKIRKE
jgi:hypothetical protein